MPKVEFDEISLIINKENMSGDQEEINRLLKRQMRRDKKRESRRKERNYLSD